MDISETWKKLERERLERPIEGNLQQGRQSQHPVAKLKRNYFMKTVMMSVFVGSFTGLLFLFDQLLIRSILAVLLIAYIIFLTVSFLMYKGIRTDLSMDGSLLDVLTATKQQIERALRFEMTSSLLVFPIAGAGGYLMGYTVTGGDTDNIFASSAQVVIFILTLIVFTVLGYFLGKRLTREGYGKSLEEMGRMIEELRR